MKLITEASAEKLRGGFYTPEPIAEFILRWGINGSNDFDILEPSCGDGIFLEQLEKQKLKYKSITAVELNEEEAAKAEKINLKNKQIIIADFHTYCNSTLKRFDLIVGNPPYIRYQFFDRQQQAEAGDIFIKAGLTYSKLTNAWVSFVVGSSLLLKDKGGRIGFVLPAEVLQVTYALQLRKFLAHFYNKINIISFEKLVFPDIQQEVVLLLCEKNETKNHNIEHIELRDASDLQKLDVAIPRNKLVVITGLSGSGKSSLAFDTLYAEGQRRYVESLSSYARQFLGRLDKPKVEYIKGIAPAIAIEQKVNTTNARSTVGTSTEIYDYLKLMYARIGKTFSPVSNQEVKKDSVSDVINLVKTFEIESKWLLLTPIILEKGRKIEDKIKSLNNEVEKRDLKLAEFINNKTKLFISLSFFFANCFFVFFGCKRKFYCFCGR
jgi:hypothetical protein